MLYTNRSYYLGGFVEDGSSNGTCCGHFLLDSIRTNHAQTSQDRNTKAADQTSKPDRAKNRVLFVVLRKRMMRRIITPKGPLPPLHSSTSYGPSSLLIRDVQKRIFSESAIWRVAWRTRRLIGLRKASVIRLVSDSPDADWTGFSGGCLRRKHSWI